MTLFSVFNILYKCIILYESLFSTQTWITHVDTCRSKPSFLLLWEILAHDWTTVNVFSQPLTDRHLPFFFPSYSLSYSLIPAVNVTCPLSARGPDFLGEGALAGLWCGHSFSLLHLQFASLGFWANPKQYESSFFPHILYSKLIWSDSCFWQSNSHEMIFHCTYNFHFPDYPSTWNKNTFSKRRERSESG